MALADDIAALRDRALADLAAEHDYFLDARVAWRIVRNGIASGQTTGYRNSATGNITGAAELLKKSRQYVRVRLVQATFQEFISIFENFFFDLLRLWLTAYPQSLAGRKVDFKAILEAPDKEAIVLLAIEREVGEILYDRPANWFAYLEDRVKLGCPTPDEIGRIAEAKASRDALVHNRGVAGKIYETKAGRFARCVAGQRIEVRERYHRETWQLLRKVIADVSNAAIAKAP